MYLHVQFLFSFRFISAPHQSVFLVTYLSGNIIVLPERLFSANNTCTSVFFIFVYVPFVKGISRRVNDSV